MGTLHLCMVWEAAAQSKVQATFQFDFPRFVGLLTHTFTVYCCLWLQWWHTIHNTSIKKRWKKMNKKLGKNGNRRSAQCLGLRGREATSGEQEKSDGRSCHMAVTMNLKKTKRMARRREKMATSKTLQDVIHIGKVEAKEEEMKPRRQSKKIETIKITLWCSSGQKISTGLSQLTARSWEPAYRRSKEKAGGAEFKARKGMLHNFGDQGIWEATEKKAVGDYPVNKWCWCRDTLKHPWLRGAFWAFYFFVSSPHYKINK